MSSQAWALDCVRSKQGSLRLCLLYNQALFVEGIVNPFLKLYSFQGSQTHLQIFMMHAENADSG